MLIPLSAIVILLAGAYGFWAGSSLPLNETADEWFDAHETNLSLVQLPADDAPHQDYVEWWYYNGHLTDEAGRQYSFHFVVFLVNALGTHTVVHASLVDHSSGEHLVSQGRAAGNPSSGTVGGFLFDLDEWRLEGGGGFDELSFEAGSRRLNLTLREAVEPVMQGGNGVLDFKDTGASYYYSRPRMSVVGAIQAAGQEEPVTGVAWFDHQWGDFDVFELGWDWFSLQLDDGRDIMLYRLFDPRDGRSVLVSGTLSDKDGATVLERGDFELEVLDFWESPKTQRRYPMEWRITIAKFGLRLTVEPVIRGAEFDARTTTYMVYWEGPVRVIGTVEGVGYMELSGYGRPSSDAN